MKIRILYSVFFLLALWQLSTASMRDPNNPPTGRTGAPNETTCAAPGCHSGGAYTGTVSISGVPDTILANTTYQITLTNTSNAVRTGFQLTCLDSSNVKCGTLSNGSGTSVATAIGRQYIRQSSAKTLSNGSASWTFSWKSPAAASGNTAKFYFVSLAANGNGNNNGDNVLIGAKSVVFQQTVATNETPYAALVNVFPNVADEVLQVRLVQSASGQLVLFDLQGRVVLQSSLAQENRIDISRLEAGMYVAQVQFDGKTVSKRFLVQ